MRIGSIDGRATLIIPGTGPTEDISGIDIQTASHGRFSADTLELLQEWEDLRQWASTVDLATTPVHRVDWHLLEAPVAQPKQIFAIGMNYSDHAAEVNLSTPTTPAVFTKFSSALAGPEVTVALPTASVDWEVELVAVIGVGGRNIPRESALDHVAGYMVGQDLSERELQFAGGGVPQFSLAKSYPGFAPTGPWITSSDEIADPGALSMVCSRAGRVLQKGTTKNLVFDLPHLIEHLSSVVELYPGDLIFTGTPDGVGFGRSPQEYLVPGDELVSSIEGLGEIRQQFTLWSGATASEDAGALGRFTVTLG